MTDALTHIITRLREYRKRIAREHLQRGLLVTLLVGFILFGLAITAESLRYYSSDHRTILLLIISGVLILLCAGTFIWWLIVRNGWIHSYDIHSVARDLGLHYPEISDQVTNALDLVHASAHYGFSDSLIQQAIQVTAKRLKSIPLSTAISPHTRQRLLKVAVSILGFWVIVWAPFVHPVSQAVVRLFHPGTTYPVPKPFSFTVQPGNTRLLDAEPLEIRVRVSGEQPEQVMLTTTDITGEETIVLSPDSAGQYSHRIESVDTDLDYQVHAPSPHWWDRWDEIRSPVYHVATLSRPQIQSLAIKLIPPKYSGMPPRHQEITTTEIVALKGTQVQLMARTNKPVKDATVHFKGRKITQSMDISDRGIRTAFPLLHPDVFTIQLKDVQGTANVNPVAYKLTPIADESPRVEILRPSDDVDLGDNLQIPLLLRLQDDYGFSRLAIQYQIIKPALQDQDSTWKSTGIPLDQTREKATEISHLWDLNSLNLSPRDEIRYRAALWDNDIISGPKVGYSETLTARFPSLSDMFARNQQQQNKSMENAEDIREQVEKIKQQVDQLTLEMQKKEEINWQQKQEAEHIIQSHKEIKKKLQELSKQLDEMLQEAQKHQLLSDDLTKKYQQLQQLFRDVMTPELQEALDKLQQAMDKADPKKVQQAMEELQGSEKDLSESLDRALELFKRVKMEQGMDEVVQRINDLLKKQKDVTTKSDSTSAQTGELSQQQQGISDEYEITQKRMEELRDLMSEFENTPKDQMDQALQQAESDSIHPNMQQAQQQFQQGNRQSGRQRSQRSQQGLQNLAQQLQQAQSTLQQNMMQEVLDQFRSVLGDVLSLSQQEESLKQQTSSLQNKSPVLGQMADKQQNLQVNLQHVVGKIIDLSQKTFGINREIGKGLGQAASNMQKATGELADRRASQAANTQQSAMAALNETAKQLVSSMKDLQSSGSSTGFENYMKQMQKMAAQQQSLNQQSAQLGMSGKPTLAQQAAMQRLAAQQMGLRQSLRDLQGQMQQSGGRKGLGDMNQVGKDMEEVARDLRNKDFTRKTLERQQKILSRLLDAQKSLRTRDLSKERESETGENVARSGPAGLPSDYGERQNLLQQDLNRALREGYARNYEDVIRDYFNSLNKSDYETSGKNRQD